MDLAAVVDDARDPQLAWGGPLRALATALAAGRGVPAARAALVDVAGPEAAVAAVGVCAVFAMMNRVVDAAGLPLPDHGGHTARALGLGR